MNLNVYIMMHKLCEIIPYDNKVYKRMLLGGNNVDINNLDLSYDSTGDNISFKNPFYCELTGLYWIWKNDESDIVGLVHYRRFFSEFPWISNKCLLKEKKILKIFSKDIDIILPFKYYGRNNIYKTNYDRYKAQHIISDLDCVKDIIKEMYPDYVTSFENLMSENCMYLFNMFIAKKEIVNNYCDWLFSILFELEKRIDYLSRDTYQRRVFGFISERLFNVWILKNKDKLKIKELNYFMPTESLITRIYRSFKYITTFCKGKNYDKTK